MKFMLALAAVLVLPVVAHAGVYDIHVGGICSTQFSGNSGGGTGYLGTWPGETSVDAPIDQTNSMATASSQLASTLDTYCTGGNYCYVYAYSNGGAVLSRTLALYANAWNIGYVATAASNEGGSQLGGTGWLGEIFGGCYLAGHIGPSDHRNGWNHNDTHGVIIGGVGGNGWLAPYAQSAILPGHDDGAVSEAAAGSYASSSGVSTMCGGGKYANHQAWWSCEYGSLNHYDLKMKAICDDGGASGCP